VRPGSDRAVAIARTIRSLTDASELPGPADFEAVATPQGRAWVRRIAGRNLWLWYRFNDDEVILVTVTTEPPLPVDEPPG
jgi:hypothetical protein